MEASLASLHKPSCSALWAEAAVAERLGSGPAGLTAQDQGDQARWKALLLPRALMGTL